MCEAVSELPLQCSFSCFPRESLLNVRVIWAGLVFHAGAWAEMQFDTESGYADPSGNATDQRAQVRGLRMPGWPLRSAGIVDRWVGAALCWLSRPGWQSHPAAGACAGCMLGFCACRVRG